MRHPLSVILAVLLAVSAAFSQVVISVDESVSKNQDKNCTIYCSKRMGWKELASPLEGDYESVLAPEGCFGVLVDASGNRRAWMVHRASPYDKSGLAIFVR